MQKIGLIHYNFPGSLEDFLRYASENGFEYVEVQFRDVWPEGEENPERRAGEVRKLLDRYGLKASALSAGNDFVYLDEEPIKAQVRRMERLCKFAKILGTDILRTEGGRPKPDVPQERWAEAIAGCLRRCVEEFGEREGCRFAVDNHGLITNDAELQVEVFRRVGSDLVGANLDTMNYRWFGHSLETVRRFYEIIAPYVLHTHMKDGIGAREQYRGTALGEGEVDLEWAIRCLKDAGYQGVWCVEYEGKEPVEGYRKGLEYLRAHL